MIKRTYDGVNGVLPLTSGFVRYGVYARDDHALISKWTARLSPISNAHLS
jgi:hypothetical protein